MGSGGIGGPAAARAGALVGREPERAVLDRMLSGAADAPPVAHLHGPGGIGKSSLSRYAAWQAELSGRRVVRMAEEAEGPASAAAVAHRVCLQPEAFRVHRYAGSSTPVSFMAIPRLDAPLPEDHAVRHRARAAVTPVATWPATAATSGPGGRPPRVAFVEGVLEALRTWHTPRAFAPASSWTPLSCRLVHPARPWACVAPSPPPSTRYGPTPRASKPTRPPGPSPRP